MITPAEIERRFKNIRTAMAAASVDALLVCGNQYSGFEGAARYVSGFEIVHRYLYVLIPLAGDPILVFPKEARWIGDKKKPWVKEHVWPDVPGKWIREHAEGKNWKRLAVFGLDYIMNVRDYRELQPGNYDLVPFDFQFDMARATIGLGIHRHGLDAHFLRAADHTAGNFAAISDQDFLEHAYSGMLPCLRHGLSSFLLASMVSARFTRLRVSLGMITSSM